MDDKELYRQILGVVAPWKIERIELEMDNDRVDTEYVNIDVTSSLK